MIAKIIKSIAKTKRWAAHAVRLLRYFVVPKPDPKYLPGVHTPGERVLRAPETSYLPQLTMPSGSSALAWAKGLAQQLLRVTKQFRLQAKLPKHLFEHLTVSFAPQDRSRLGDNDYQRGQKGRDIVVEALELFGLKAHPWVLVVHGDTSHIHVHVLVGTVGLDGKVWSPRRDDLRRLELIMEQLEVKYGLTRVLPRLAMSKEDPSRTPLRRAPTAGEARKGRDTGQPSVRERLQDLVDEALEDAGEDFCEFVDALLRRRVQLVPYRFEKGRLGVAYRLDGIALGGTKLGRAYTWPAISSRLKFDASNPEHAAYVDVKVASELSRQCSTCLEIRCGTKSVAPLPRPKRSTLSKMELMEEKGVARYKWRGSAVAALEASGPSIAVKGFSPGAVQAALELAASKGWSTAGISGTPQAVAHARQCGRKLGIDVHETLEPVADLDIDRWRKEDLERKAASQRRGPLPGLSLLGSLDIPKPRPDVSRRRPR